MAEYKTLVVKIPISPDRKTKQKDYLKNGLLPIVDQGQGVIGGYTNDLRKAVDCKLPVLVFGDHTRAEKLISFSFGIGADGIKVIQPKENILPRYLYYGTQYIVSKMPDRGYARHYQYVEKEDLTVPTLPEQKRIVSRIETLFSQLDAAVDSLRTVKAQLAVYRQAVLKDVFSTVDCFIPLGIISDSRLGKMLDKEKNTGSPRRYLRNINVRWFKFDLDDLLEMKIEDTEVEKYSICKGDLVICEGGEPGRCAVWDHEESIFFQKALHRVRFIDCFEPKYYMYYIWYASQTGKLNSYFTGTGIKHLTGQKLIRIPVPLADVITQRKTISNIESRMSVCDSIEQTVDTALRQAEAMRQSILKRAFEGRL